jgi:hypothetical protein
MPPHIGVMRQNSFGALNKKNELLFWHYCRESFHDQVRQLDTFLFGNGKKDWRDIASFMRMVESRLKLSERSEFGPTIINGTMWVKAPKWWSKSNIRRYFYTMMLRAAMKYSRTKRNFLKSLWSIGYTRQSRYAVERFLSGFTKYKGRSSRIDGWFDIFEFSGNPLMKNTYESKVRKLLVRP